jgi:hypothetical protein
MAEKRPEAWGGEVHLPRWMRRLRRKPEATDTPQKLAETHKGKVAKEPERTVLENVDRTLWGGFRDLPK